MTPMFSNCLMITQICVMFILFTFVRWDASKDYESDEYVIVRDIMVMLLLGFGFLMTFLSKYGLGAVGFTMLLTAVAIELNLILEPWLSPESKLSSISLTNVIDGEFSAATALISYGAIIGRATPTQLLIMTLLQSIFYVINKVFFVFGWCQAEDVGGTMTIHMFGAYFGLAVSRVLGPPKSSSVHNASPSAVSDLYSLIGTTLLWVYWPSFVGATETGNPSYERYCVSHTIMALLGSTTATFYMSQLLKHGKFDAVHIANSTLAGGVAIGSSARLPDGVGPAGSFVLGTIVGCVSVYGYSIITPQIMEGTRLQIYDTCGIHSLHGLPSIVGGLASAFFVLYNPNVEFLLHSSTIVQAFFQLVAVTITLTFAIGTGTITGMVMKAYGSDDDTLVSEYDDSTWWEGEYFEESHDSNKLVKPHHPDETTPLTSVA